MPDAHLGYAMPIGGVVSLEHAISPSFVGYDISCMMQLSLVDLTPADFMAARPTWPGCCRPRLHSVWAPTSPRAAGTCGDGRPALAGDHVLTGLKATAQRQLGSSGGGNHFADLVILDFVRDHGAIAPGTGRLGC